MFTYFINNDNTITQNIFHVNDNIGYIHDNMVTRQITSDGIISAEPIADCNIVMATLVKTSLKLMMHWYKNGLHSAQHNTNSKLLLQWKPCV